MVSHNGDHKDNYKYLLYLILCLSQEKLLQALEGVRELGNYIQ
jgi:hypothetical protein